MSTSTKIERYTPAYVASETFLTFIKSFDPAVGVPDHIDKSLMPRMAGGTRGHLLAALKFLGLIEDDGKVVSMMRDLIDSMADPAVFSSTLRAVLCTAYKPVLGEQDVTKCTLTKLQERFREAGATGATTGKAIRFYLKTLKATGMELPKHLAGRQGGSSNTVARRESGDAKERPRKTKTRQPNKERTQEAGGQQPEGTMDFPLAFADTKGCIIRVPTSITMDEITIIETMVSAIKAVAAQNSPKETN